MERVAGIEPASQAWKAGAYCWFGMVFDIICADMCVFIYAFMCVLMGVSPHLYRSGF